MKKPIRVKSATFYQGVTARGEVVNTIHEGTFDPQGSDRKKGLKNCSLWYMAGLLMIKSPEDSETDVYIGMANVRSMELYKEDCLFPFEKSKEELYSDADLERVKYEELKEKSKRLEHEQELVRQQEIGKKLNDEDTQKILLTEAILRAGGKKPHPQTGIEKLKAKLAEAGAANNE